MFAQIYSNLHRQQKALELLESLLYEEYGLLQKRDTDAIGQLEFSLHELLRQIADERGHLKEHMNGTRVLEYATLLPEEDGEAVRQVMTLIDAAEQRCARQASHNAELSLALLDQSHELMTVLHSQIVPPRQETYSAKGRFMNHRPEAALLSGRM